MDAVITYVNSSDNLWFRDYAIATKSHNPTPTRFRSWGTLKYLFRGIATYMPFIKNVILIVARESQVPAWVNRSNVRIVYHDEFIPKKYLPTFNSCTIESYLWNIKDLGERIIYFNDDMFPNAPMMETDFFTGDIPHNKFHELEEYNPKRIFRAQCRAGVDLITKAMGLPDYPAGVNLRPYHIVSAICKSSLDNVAELCGETISKTVTKLRTGNNVNQYIYLYYQYFTHNYIDDIVDYTYYELTEKNMDNIAAAITDTKYKMLCLNDSENIKDYTKLRIRLHNVFDAKFPDKCKYEI